MSTRVSAARACCPCSDTCVLRALGVCVWCVTLCPFPRWGARGCLPPQARALHLPRLYNRQVRPDATGRWSVEGGAVNAEWLLQCVCVECVDTTRSVAALRVLRMLAC